MAEPYGWGISVSDSGEIHLSAITAASNKPRRSAAIRVSRMPEKGLFASVPRLQTSSSSATTNPTMAQKCAYDVSVMTGVTSPRRLALMA